MGATEARTLGREDEAEILGREDGREILGDEKLGLGRVLGCQMLVCEELDPVSGRVLTDGVDHVLP